MLVLLLGFAFSIVCLQAVNGQVHTIMVPSDYNPIQSAINAASNGDTILVGPGRYYEGIYVNKSVTIIGQSPATTTVYGTSEGYQSGGVGNPFYISASNVVIANFSIKQGAEYNGAISASSDNIVIRDNVITESGSGGISIALQNCVNFAIKGNTIIQGAGRMDVRGSRVGEISGNTISGLEYPLVVYGSSNITLSQNLISQCEEGIQITNSAFSTFSQNKVLSLGGGITGAITLSKCPGSVLRNNEVSNCVGGIKVSECPGALLRNNSILNCTYGFGAFGYTLEDFAMDIDASNTVNRMPIYYLINQSNLLISPSTYPQVGYLALVNSRNVTVEGLTLNNNLYGLLLAHTTDSLIVGNTFVNNSDTTIYLINQSDRNTITLNQIQSSGVGVRAFYSYNEKIIGNNIGASNGVWLEQSSNNTIIGNNLTRNYQTLHFVSTTNNAIYHNNFIKNTLQMATWGGIGDYSITYPSGGNYWSDYSGLDEFKGTSQGEPGSDGIIDNAFVYRDLYPLVAPVQIFETTVNDGNIVYVELISNSTTTDIHFDASEHTFSFSAFGPLGATGFFRITLPNSLIQTVWNNKYAILVNGIQQTFQSLTDAQNTYLYITYGNLKPILTPTSTPTQNPSAEPSATPSPSVPELSHCAVVVLGILATTAILVSPKRKVNPS